LAFLVEAPQLNPSPEYRKSYSIDSFANPIETLIPPLKIRDFILEGHSLLELPLEIRYQQRSAYSSVQSAEFAARNILSASARAS
jgi:hypothetical protein